MSRDATRIERRVGWTVVALTLLLALGGAAWPAGAIDSLSELLTLAELSGSLRGGYWSSSRQLDDREHLATAALWLKAAPKLPLGLSALVEGRVMNQQLFREDETDGVLREAYIQGSSGAFDVRLGKQIIAWGRADRINPTDNLTPRDYTLLVPEDDDQRIGRVAAKVSYFRSGFTATAIWLPDFEPHTIPLRPPPPPLQLREAEPSNTLNQWALKLDRTGQGFDWSLSYYNGFDLFPDLGIERRGPMPIGLLLSHHRIQVVGADATTTLGRYGLRGEAAYTFTADARGSDPEVKNPFFFLVLGANRTFREHLNINVQYIFRAIIRYQDPTTLPTLVQRNVAIRQALINNQLDPIQHAFSARISERWFNDTLETELGMIFALPRSDFVFRPKLTYAFSDHWKGTLGADIFGGRRVSFFGNLRDNSAVYVEVRWSF